MEEYGFLGGTRIFSGAMTPFAVVKQGCIGT
jgi:hypothetical protein